MYKINKHGLCYNESSKIGISKIGLIFLQENHKEKVTAC